MLSKRGNLWDYHDRGFWAVIPTNLGWHKDGSNVMGCGVALQAAQKWPDLPVDYGAACKAFTALGESGLWVCDDERLICFPVKPLDAAHSHLSWRQSASLELIERSTPSRCRWLAAVLEGWTLRT